MGTLRHQTSGVGEVAAEIANSLAMFERSLDCSAAAARKSQILQACQALINFHHCRM